MLQLLQPAGNPQRSAATLFLGGHSITSHRLEGFQRVWSTAVLIMALAAVQFQFGRRKPNVFFQSSYPLPSVGASDPPSSLFMTASGAAINRMTSSTVGQGRRGRNCSDRQSGDRNLTWIAPPVSCCDLSSAELRCPSVVF